MPFSASPCLALRTLRSPRSSGRAPRRTRPPSDVCSELGHLPFPGALHLESRVLTGQCEPPVLDWQEDIGSGRVIRKQGEVQAQRRPQLPAWSLTGPPGSQEVWLREASKSGGGGAFPGAWVSTLSNTSSLCVKICPLWFSDLCGWCLKHGCRTGLV